MCDALAYLDFRQADDTSLAQVFCCPALLLCGPKDVDLRVRHGLHRPGAAGAAFPVAVAQKRGDSEHERVAEEEEDIHGHEHDARDQQPRSHLCSLLTLLVVGVGTIQGLGSKRVVHGCADEVPASESRRDATGRLHAATSSTTNRERPPFQAPWQCRITAPEQSGQQGQDDQRESRHEKANPTYGDVWPILGQVQLGRNVRPDQQALGGTGDKEEDLRGPPQARRQRRRQPGDGPCRLRLRLRLELRPRLRLPRCRSTHPASPS
mmetsp:Transcript_123784/g.396188  ORF Transcript_123784/g.396188 Transcript_123784/m.396188 type:complete len:265 (-) Transcript_123784:546-1340(-)